MNIRLYSFEKNRVHEKCRVAMLACGFTVEQDDAMTGFLSASKTSDFPMPLACLTTSIKEDRSGSSVSVVSSFLSVLFGNFSDNPSDEEKFVEELLVGLQNPPYSFAAAEQSVLQPVHAGTW